MSLWGTSHIQTITPCLVPACSLCLSPTWYTLTHPVTVLSVYSRCPRRLWGPGGKSLLILLPALSFNEDLSKIFIKIFIKKIFIKKISEWVSKWATCSQGSCMSMLSLNTLRSPQCPVSGRNPSSLTSEACLLALNLLSCSLATSTLHLSTLCSCSPNSSP